MRTFESFEEYSRLAMRTAHHPTGSKEALLYCGVALAGEAGEVANEIKKVARDDRGVLSEERRLKIIDEIGDTLWYLNSLANEIGSTLQWCAMRNIQKLEERHATILAAGSEQPHQDQHSVVCAAGSGVRA